MSGEGQSRHAYLGVFSVQNGMGAGFQRGSCGYYVVDEQYVFSGEGVGFGEGEFLADVLPAAETTFLGLSLSKFGAYQHVGNHGSVEFLGYAFGNLLTLVVATFFQLFGVQRHGHKVVDVVETVAFGEGGAELSAHKNAEFLVALVLDAVQNSLHAPFF